MHAVPFFTLSNWEIGAIEMRDRARDWSEQGRRPRGAVPLARNSLSLTVDEKRKGLCGVYSWQGLTNPLSHNATALLMWHMGFKDTPSLCQPFSHAIPFSLLTETERLYQAKQPDASLKNHKPWKNFDRVEARNSDQPPQPKVSYFLELCTEQVHHPERIPLRRRGLQFSALFSLSIGWERLLSPWIYLPKRALMSTGFQCVNYPNTNPKLCRLELKV